VRPIPAVAALLLLTPSGCAPEAVAPQGWTITKLVVPVAVPDRWCPAVSDTTPEDKRQCHQYPAPNTPAPEVVVDSTVRDTTWRQ
jgi:hypothetical protein